MWTVFGAGWAVLTPHLAGDSERAVAPIKRVAGSDLLVNPIFSPDRPDPGNESAPPSIYDTVDGAWWLAPPAAVDESYVDESYVDECCVPRVVVG